MADTTQLATTTLFVPQSVPKTRTNITERTYHVIAKILERMTYSVTVEGFGPSNVVELCEQASDDEERRRLRYLFTRISDVISTRLSKQKWMVEQVAMVRGDINDHCEQLKDWKEESRCDTCIEENGLEKSLVPPAFVGDRGWDDAEKEGGKEVTEADWQKWSDWVDFLADADAECLWGVMASVDPVPTWLNKIAAYTLLLESFGRIEPKPATNDPGSMSGRTVETASTDPDAMETDVDRNLLEEMSISDSNIEASSAADKMDLD